MNLKGSKTEKNLMTAFAGESQARNKYTYYASKAKKEGFEQIAAIFQETADNEKEHAKIWFKLLHDGIQDTATNLKDAAAVSQYGADYYYNLGNAAAAMEDWQAAVDAYAQSLLRNPGDMDAKENYVYARGKLKDQQNGGGQNDQDQNNDQNDQDKNDQDQDNQNNQRCQHQSQHSACREHSCLG